MNCGPTLIAACLIASLMGCTPVSQSAKQKAASSAQSSPLSATYRRGMDKDGCSTITCVLSNISSEPVFVTGHVTCGWSMVSKPQSAHHIETEGIFWIGFCSVLPVYYRLEPVRPEILADNLEPDWSLQGSGRLEVGSEKIDASDATLSVALSAEVRDKAFGNPKMVTVVARELEHHGQR